MNNKPHLNELIALFIAALATLLFEITITRIFSYTTWANYAYLVISTAMFGFGFSGVILTRWPSLIKKAAGPFLATCCALSGITMFIAFLLVNNVPIHLPDVPVGGWGIEIRNIAIVFLGLAVPYTFFGLVVAYILDCRARNANTYYFADLLGAGIGAFMLVPTISIWEPDGLVLFSTLACLGAAALFLMTPSGEGKSRMATPLACVGALLLILSVVLPSVGALDIPVNIHVAKRSYKLDTEGREIVKSGWSALSRIDVANLPLNPAGEDPGMKRVWIDGGVNESNIPQFDGDFEASRAMRESRLERATQIGDYTCLPHLIRSNHTVCVIGTSGGVDSMTAIEMGARHVTGVEMDPMIVKMTTEYFNDYNGNMWKDNDYMKLVLDEGRSFLKRSPEKFDVIQQVNNFTRIAMQNGALNLSETYLLTTESFGEFYDSLTDDGLLVISRWGAPKLVSTAVEMFRNKGWKPEQYRQHIVVVQGTREEIYTLMVKKSPWEKWEVDRICTYLEGHPRNVQLTGSRRDENGEPLVVLGDKSTYAAHGTVGGLLAAPFREDMQAIFHRPPGASDYQPFKNIYRQLIEAENPEEYWRHGAFDFTPPTDDKPFFDHLVRFGARDSLSDRLNPDWVPYEIISIAPRSVLDHRIPKGDLPPVIILIEAALLATLFFGLPLFTKKELRIQLSQHKRILGYFACLGLGFMLVEICLMKRLVLFLGAPVYSIAVVLGGLLISAGVGSLLSGRIKLTNRSLRNLLWFTTAAIVSLHFVIPVATDLFLGHSFGVRVAVALVFISIAGVVMGMPMPTGIRYLKENKIDIIPWAWAMNGYFTVIGTALTVVLAVNLGFTFVFFFAAAIYFIAPFFILKRS